MAELHPVPTFAAAPLEELFAAMRSDDPAVVDAAWSECYRQYGERVWSRVYYVLRGIHWLKEPGEAAVDVTSEIFARLPEALKSYREMGKPQAWLMQLALRAALRQKESITGNWSGRSSAPRVSVDLDDVVGRISGEIDGVELEARLTLERCLARWKAEPGKQQWIAFVELFLEGYGHEEIAERLGITPGTSRTWLWKIRRELGSMIEGEETP